VCPVNGSVALSVVTEGELLEEDAVAQEAEARSAIHLPFDQLGLGVDAFGAAVVVLAGQGCVDGVLGRVADRG
jgi:tagatose-1,6-bisphosphate aldolase